MMKAAAPTGVSATRAVWLLTCLRLKRVANQMTMIYNRPLSGRKGRAATSGKRRNRWAVSGVVAFFMLFAYGNIARQSIVNLHRALDHVPYARSMASGPLSDALMRGLAMQLSLLLIAGILGTLASRELSQPDWDLEWLATLPLRTPILLLCRIMERSIANPLGLMTLLPAGILIAWISGYRWSAPVLGALAILPLLVLAAIARTLIDTGLRLSLAPSRLRNLQAVLSIVSIVLLYLVISLGMASPMTFVLEWAREFPNWASWLPPGLVVRALNAPQVPAQVEIELLLIIEIGIILWGSLALIAHQLRNGVVAASSRETAGRSIAPSALPGPPSPRPMATVVQRRELKLLLRDRTFLVQTLVLPVVIVASQVIFQGRLHGSSFAGASNAAVASIAFGIASYTLMMSAFQTLNSEGGALWLLFTVPRSVESVLKEKAQLWAILALGYPVAVFAIASVIKSQVDVELIGLAAIVLLGVPIYTVIAVALGVFGCDPLAQEVNTKIRPTYVYLFMMLAGLYTYAIFASEWWQRIVLIVLSGLLALALWQKARDELPYLLDSAASPPARVSTSDGLIAAMIFFVIQGIAAVFLRDEEHHQSARALIIGYSLAGGLTFGLFRLSFWRSKTTGVPAILGPRFGRAAAWGAGAGVIAASGGVIYLFLLRHLGFMQDDMRDSAGAVSAGMWIAVLAVVAAPVFEEFIFRGLIFGGLRRSLGAAPAIAASAAVFAIVHPPASMLPVFGLGVCAAVAYERSKLLLAPMIAHGLYNAAVLAFQTA